MRVVLEGGPLLASCLFDSDSDSPGAPSKASIALGTACTAANMHHYRLARRAIENYLPRSGFERWIALGGNRADRRERREKVDGFFALSKPDRHHTRVKDRVGPVGSLYGDDAAMNDRDLATEGGPLELETFVRELIERVR